MKHRLLDVTRRLALAATAKVGIPEWLRPRDEMVVTALLFHRFFDPGEPKARGVERLRRELEWLRAHYTPISLAQLTRGLQVHSLPERSVLVTADDALLDLMHVVDELNAFEVPLAVFVCPGWTAASSRGTGEDLLVRAAAAIQWHEGADVEIKFGRGRSVALSAANKARNIDYLTRERDSLWAELPELCAKIESYVKGGRQYCNWSELRDLQRAGMDMGVHSATHVSLSTAKGARRALEIQESKRVCETMFGRCDAFAYPFGMAETHSAATRQALLDAGYRVAFLTHSDFITTASDCYMLPRISLPNESMTLPEFEARAGGAGIILRRLRRLVHSEGSAEPETS